MASPEDELQERLIQRTKDFADLFSTDTGKRVLDELKLAFWDRLSYVQGDTHETARREGQRDVYLRIANLVDRGLHPDKFEDT